METRAEDAQALLGDETAAALTAHHCSDPRVDVRRPTKYIICPSIVFMIDSPHTVIS